jgi:hypothetical protein
MFKACGIFAILAILLITIGGSADWLEGGYVRSGGSSEMAQYFTDPIFKSPASSYQSFGLALSKTHASMDRSLRLGYVASRPATSKKTVSAPTQATTAASRWSLALSEGKTIYLEDLRGRQHDPGPDHLRSIGKRHCFRSNCGNGCCSTDRDGVVLDNI